MRTQNISMGWSLTIIYLYIFEFPTVMTLRDHQEKIMRSSDTALMTEFFNLADFTFLTHFSKYAQSFQFEAQNEQRL